MKSYFTKSGAEWTYEKVIDGLGYYAYDIVPVDSDFNKGDLIELAAWALKKAAKL